MIITSIGYSLESLDAFILVGNNSRKDRNDSELDVINDQTGGTGGVDFLNGEIIVQSGVLDGEISFDCVE